MNRRRRQSNGSSLVREYSKYENKSGKYNNNAATKNRVLKTFVWVSTGIVALFLIAAISDLLQSNNSNASHYEPNTMHTSTSTSTSTKQTEPNNKRTESNNKRTEPNAVRLPTTNRTRDEYTPGNLNIPYVRYDPDFQTIKKEINFAIESGDENLSNNTCGQHLLDFGIIGFPKCGTTTMMRWLNKHNEIAVFPKEMMSLQKQHPAMILRFITKQLPEGRYRRGYKSPNDVENGRCRNKLKIHYPKTKLLVGLRHPVLWFESFYNHRVQNSFKMPSTEMIENPKKSLTNCAGVWQGACLPRANFHISLAKWGKTPLLSLDKKGYDSYYGGDYQNDKEWELFPQREIGCLKRESNTTFISPNPIFLFEVNQLRMSDDESKSQKDYEDFVLSLQDFLGVSKNASAMPAMMRESPGKKGLDNVEQARVNKLKIDICDEKFIVARKMFIEIGTNMADWITQYFAKSPHGVTLGGGVNDDGKSRLLKILESYKNDPCPERRKAREAALAKNAKLVSLGNSQERNATVAEPKAMKKTVL